MQCGGIAERKIERGGCDRHQRHQRERDPVARLARRGIADGLRLRQLRAEARDEFAHRCGMLVGGERAPGEVVVELALVVAEHRGGRCVLGRCSRLASAQQGPDEEGQRAGDQRKREQPEKGRNGQGRGRKGGIECDETPIGAVPRCCARMGTAGQADSSRRAVPAWRFVPPDYTGAVRGAIRHVRSAPGTALRKHAKRHWIIMIGPATRAPASRRTHAGQRHPRSLARISSAASAGQDLGNPHQGPYQPA